jgi:hypothetical protein
VVAAPPAAAVINAKPTGDTGSASHQNVTQDSQALQDPTPTATCLMSPNTAPVASNATTHSNRTTQLLPITKHTTHDNTSGEDCCAAPNSHFVENSCAADLAPTALVKYVIKPSQQLLAAITNNTYVEDSCAAQLAPTALIKYDTNPSQQLLAATPNSISVADSCAANPALTALVKYDTKPQQQLLAAIHNNTSVESSCAAHLAPTALVINPSQQLLAAIPNNTSAEDSCAADPPATALVKFVTPSSSACAARLSLPRSSQTAPLLRHPTCPPAPPAC